MRMGAIKTRFNKVSSSALQKVTGKLKRHPQVPGQGQGQGQVQVQVHDCRAAGGGVHFQSQHQHHHHHHQEAAPVSASTPKHDVVFQFVNQVEDDYYENYENNNNLNHKQQKYLTDPRVLPVPITSPFPPPLPLPASDCGVLDPALLAVANNAHANINNTPVASIAPAAVQLASDSPELSSSSPSTTSRMSLEYTTTTTTAFAPGIATQEGTHSKPIDLTAASSPLLPPSGLNSAATTCQGNSPTSPIDLTKSSPRSSAHLDANNMHPSTTYPGHQAPPFPEEALDYMDIDEFEVLSALEYKFGGGEEDFFNGYRDRQMEEEQMRKDEAMARELQDQLDRDAAVQASMSPLAPRGHEVANNTNFSGGFAAASASSSASSSHSSSTFSPITDDQDEEVARAYGQAALRLRCPKCKVLVVEDPADIILLPSGSLSSGTMCSHFRCPRCKNAICLGCNVSSGDADVFQNGSGSSMILSGQGITASVCCAADRAYMIWLLSCGLQVPPSPPSPSRSRTLRSSIRGKIAPSGQPALNAITSATSSYSSTSKSAYSKGVGYGGEDVYPPNHTLFKAPPPANTAQAVPASNQLSPEDQKLSAYFRAMALVLPSYERPYDFDMLPDGQIASFLRRSPLLQKAAELLRNDSIDDMLLKEGLYRAVIVFIQALAGHLVTARLVHASLVIYPVESQTFAVSVGPARLGLSNGKGKTKAAEKTQSLASIVSKLGNICRRVTQRAAAHPDDFMADDGARMISLCRSVITLDDFLTANRFEDDSGGATTTGSQQASRVAPDQAAAYSSSRSDAELMEERARKHREWHRQNCLADVVDEELWKNYYFATSARQLLTSQKGRMKRLITETTNLSSSLPEGIFVRHAGSRLDAMKVMIVGPQGTPYENGLFEFDLYCPQNYPQVPPSMQFKTTGGGTVRFNPNLYEDGKVCLSLLGTWQGPSWNPSNSTILQVLVSIQSMVFCDKPWYNEPGRERQPNESASDNYNRGIHEWTVQHAMLKWLDSTSSPSLHSNTGGPALRIGMPLPSNNGRPRSADAISSMMATTVTSADEYIWGDVVREHFTTHGKAILDMVKKWKGRGLKNGKIGSLATQLNTAMAAKGYLT